MWGRWWRETFDQNRNIESCYIVPRAAECSKLGLYQAFGLGLGLSGATPGNSMNWDFGA